MVPIAGYRSFFKIRCERTLYHSDLFDKWCKHQLSATTLKLLFALNCPAAFIAFLWELGSTPSLRSLTASSCSSRALASETRGYTPRANVFCFFEEPIEWLSGRLEEPLVLGWDACGEAVSAGESVQNYKPGDMVMYAGDITRPGSCCYHLNSCN